ncbi:hypothetical protein BGZ80_009425 [Entomortierella chlamydospora]|uniref:Uncharacterized protein n=1 Tax=Entomortierella chlamydospora TaxID=101097 RepID=A0A9P6MWI6_9FUNG|nr:hypothetical protein BGZ79_006224 [Entomortierella chlamydospora]KAG0016119.1 hypothetical protein BGZ80_009425 [Entomortierella chlamydospora]
MVLGNLLEQEPVSDGGKTLHEVVEGYIGKTTGYGLISMIDESGSGKTETPRTSLRYTEEFTRNNCDTWNFRDVAGCGPHILGICKAV